MPQKHLVLEVYGGPAHYYREVKEEIEDRWGYEPNDHDVVSLLLENWPGCDAAEVGESQEETSDTEYTDIDLDDVTWKDVEKRPVQVEAAGPFGDPTVIETLEGDFEVDEEYAENGFYIIRGVEGEVYPCRRDIFEETYRRPGEDEDDDLPDRGEYQ